jgi:Peptidase M15
MVDSAVPPPPAGFSVDGGMGPSADPYGITPQAYFQQVRSLYPNAVFNGGGRTPERNAAVGGAPDSMHLTNQAMDFNVPGVPADQVFTSLRAAGLPMTEALNEGQVGNQGGHLHVGWSPIKPPIGGPVAPLQAPAAAIPPPPAGFAVDHQLLAISHSASTAVPPPPPGFAMDGVHPAAPAVPPPPPGFSVDGGQHPNQSSNFLGTIGDLFGGAKPGQQPNAVETAIMNLANSHPIQGLVGSYQQAVTGGLLAQPVRAAMEGMGYGMDQLKARFPNETPQWYATQLHQMYGKALTAARTNAQQQTAQNPYPGHQVGNFIAGVAGSPENLLLGGAGTGETVAMRMATAAGANALINTTSDAAAQGMDMLEGEKKNFDVQQSLRAAQTGAVLGGALHGVTEAAPFVADLFKNRGIDTTPGVDPRGPTSPTTGATPTMTPEEQVQFKSLLKTGSVDDIKNFLADKQGPKPTYADVNKMVQFRDQMPPDFVGKDNFNQAADVHIQDLQRQAVENHVADTTANWKNAPNVEVVHGPEDVADPTIRAAAIAADNGNQVGFYGPDGTARLFSGRLNGPEEVNAALYHEALGHAGLDQTFQKNLDSTMTTLADRNVGQFGKSVTAKMTENPGMSKPLAAEETLA